MRPTGYIAAQERTNGAQLPFRIKMSGPLSAGPWDRQVGRMIPHSPREKTVYATVTGWTDSLKIGRSSIRLATLWTPCRSAEFPPRPVQDGAELFNDPHLRDRAFLTTIDHPLTGPIEYPNVPVRLWETPGRLDRWHTMGQDNNYVLETLLAMTPEEISALQRSRGPGVRAAR